MGVDLLLAVEADVLRVTVVNDGEQDLRIWSRDNSWGWSMFSLVVEAPDSGQRRELTAVPVRWTRNVPRALTVPAGATLDDVLRRSHPAWEEGAGGDDDWLDQPVQVQVRLRVSDSPEALEQGVFVGEAVSPPVLSTPPHSWFSRETRRP